MADRFPLILNTSANQIQEIASGDQLDLSGNNIANAGIITATSFVGSGAALTGIDATAIKDSGGNVKVQAQASGAVYTGIHTFNSGAEVGSNIQLGNAGVVTATTFKGDGDFVELDVDGHTNLDNVSVAGVVTATTFSGSGASLTGIVNGNISASAAIAGTKISPDFGSQNITTTGTLTTGGQGNFSGNLVVNTAYPQITLNDTDSDSDFLIQNANGTFKINDSTNSADRLNIASDGTTTIAGNLDVGAGIDVTGNVIASGNVTAVDGTFTGDVSIGGTLTYEDVTNIDSVGIITAREGIRIGAGKSIGSDGAAAVYYGDGSNLSGISVGGSSGIDFNDNVKIRMGTGNDFEIYHDNSSRSGIRFTNPEFRLMAAHSFGKIQFGVSNSSTELSYGSLIAEFKKGAECYLTYNSSQKIATSNTGISVYGTVVARAADIDDFISVGSNIHLGNAGIVTATSFVGNGSGLTSLSGSVIASALSGQDISSLGNIGINANLTARRGIFNDDGSASPTVSISTDDGSPWALQIKNDTYWNSTDNGYKIYQDNSGNVRTTVQGNGAFLNWYLQTINGGTTNTAIHIDTNRSVNLRYQDNAKLSTTSDGVDFGSAGGNDILCISSQTIHRTGSNGCGMHFTSNAIFPTNAAGTLNNGGMSFGSSSYRWANIYTSDLDLSNEAKNGNDVDGTWGHWTIQEGELDLFLINKRSGKKYKFNLTEVS